MENRKNYDNLMRKVAEQEKDKKPKLLLHACCAPCSSASLERVASDFEVTVFFYNPNITDEEEYRRRSAEEKRLIQQMPCTGSVSFLEGEYNPGRFFEVSKGLEKEPEGGARCKECFRLRIAETVKKAEELGFAYVTTTLTISPLKNAALLNGIGEEETIGKTVKWLPSDFKKRNGYKRSIELSKEYNLYRQNYCGCVFSRREASQRNGEKALHFDGKGVN